MGWLIWIIVLVAAAVALSKRDDVLSKIMLFVIGIIILGEIASIFLGFMGIIVRLCVFVLLIMVIAKIVKKFI